MALAGKNVALRGAASGIQVAEVVLGTMVTNSTKSDHADVLGYASRIYINAVNGAANSCVWGIQGSHTGGVDAEWYSLAFRRNAGASYATADITTTAAVQESVFLSGPDTPRYVRVAVTTANSNGTVFTLLAEK